MKKIITILILAFAVQGAAQAQINLKKLGNTIKKGAEQQVEQKVKEKAARETREALDRGEKKLDDAVSGNKTESSSSNSSAVSSTALSNSNILGKKLPEDVRQAIENLKNPDLAPPTCWAYAPYASQSGPSITVKEDKIDPLPIEKMTHRDFSILIYRFSNEELDAIKKQVEDRYKYNMFIYSALHDSVTEREKPGVGQALSDNGVSHALFKIKEEIENYHKLMGLLRSTVSRNHSIKDLGNREYKPESITLGRNYINEINGVVYFVIYDQRGNPIITPADADMYDYYRKQLMGIQRFIKRTDGSPQYKEYDYTMLILDFMEKGQKNALAKQEKLPVPASRMNNPALKTKMLQLARQTYPSWDIKELIIVESAWRPEKDALGQIKHRRINTNIILPNGSGGYKMRTLSFIEPYAGGGKYGEVQAFGIGTDDRAVNYKGK